MKRSLALLAALLALPLAACGASPAADSTTATAAPAETTDTASASQTAAAPAEAITSDGLHLATPSDSGGQYQVYTPPQADGSLTQAYLCYADYAASTLRKACGVAGCTHDSEACPAWLPRGDKSVDLLNESDALYCVTYTYADSTVQIDKLDRANTTRQTLCTFAAEETVNTYAADAQNLYLLVMIDGQYTQCTVGKADGSLTTHAVKGEAADTWQGMEVPNLIAAQGSKLYYASIGYTESGDVFAPSDLKICAYDLADNSFALVSDLASGTAQSDADGQVHQDHLYTLWGTGGHMGAWHMDLQNGTVAAVDPATGAETTIMTGLPTYATCPGLTDYLAYGFTNGGSTVLARYIENGESKSTQYYVANGTPTALPQLETNPSGGKNTIAVLDIQSDIAYVSYGMEEVNYQGADASGKLTSGSDARELFGTIPLADLLAGSEDYTPLQYE